LKPPNLLWYATDFTGKWFSCLTRYQPAFCIKNKWKNKSRSTKKIIKTETIINSMNHARLPKEVPPTRLSTSGKPSYKGWSCLIETTKAVAIDQTAGWSRSTIWPSMPQIKNASAMWRRHVVWSSSEHPTVAASCSALLFHIPPCLQSVWTDSCRFPPSLSSSTFLSSKPQRSCNVSRHYVYSLLTQQKALCIYVQVHTHIHRLIKLPISTLIPDVTRKALLLFARPLIPVLQWTHKWEAGVGAGDFFLL